MNTHVQEAERPIYLARVLSVAFHDGNIGAREMRVLRGVLLRIGASEGDLRRAIELHRAHRSLPPLRSPIARMQNIQDMIMVALADGTLADIEAAPIEKLAGLLRYSQADMDIIVKRAEQELRRVMAAIPDAGSLASVFNPGSEPEESAAAEDEATPQPSAPAKPPPVPLRKADTPPRRPAPVGPKPDRPSPSSVTESTAASDAAEAPATGSDIPPDAEASDEGTETSPVEEIVDTAEPAGEVAACEACRRNSEYGDAYCFGAGGDEVNIWGCRLLRMPWCPGAAWLGQGAFDRDGCFVFDRTALAEQLAAASRNVASCPFFDVEFLDHALAALPRKADAYGRWTYRLVGRGEAGESLEVTEFFHGCAVKRDIEVVGMDPVGTVQARKVARRAADRAGRPMPDF